MGEVEGPRGWRCRRVISTMIVMLPFPDTCRHVELMLILVYRTTHFDDKMGRFYLGLLAVRYGAEGIAYGRQLSPLHEVKPKVIF